MTIQLVFATGQDENTKHEQVRAFGNGDKLPWKHIRQDMINFNERTSQSIDDKTPAVVMGSNTFKSLPKKLTGRVNVVLSSASNGCVAKDGAVPDSIVWLKDLRGLEEMCRELEHEHGLVSIIGGKELIKEGAKFADRMFMSTIYANSDDVLFEYDTSFTYEEIEAIIFNFKHLTSSECWTIEKHGYDLIERGFVK